MSFQLDDSILEDFIAEAGELVDGLGEELVQLEQQPDDPALLNSIFRAFHTVKGGAGFLNLGSLVETCHSAENVFDALRRGDLELNADIMDAVLQALDVVTDNMDSLRAGEELAPPAPELIQTLRGFVSGPQTEPATEPPPPAEHKPVEEKPAEPAALDPADQAFEAMLAEAQGDGAGSEGADSDDSDLITDDEFEALLDQLEGKTPEATPAPTAAPAAAAPAEPASDEITDDEFEALLDDLHGQGKAPTPQDGAEAAPAAAPAEPPPPAATAAPEKPAAPPEPAAAPAGNKADAAVARAVKKAAAPQETSVRVDVSRLDAVMNLVGELVLVRNRLVNLGASLHNEELQKAVANLDLVTGDLQMGVMQTRMQPIRKVFSRFPRLTRDLARTLNKEINLEMRGEETDLDKNLVEALADPLIHLVRNSLDHGIEMPDEREAAGKPRAGTVELAAEQQGDHIVITIGDDGAGIDADRLRDKAVKKGQVSEEAAAKMTRQECFALMFAPGLSTCDKVSEVSGRGVGMDVVKTRMAELNGVIDIDSEPGVGTTIQVRVPLTLAILPTLMVRLRQRIFAFPLTHVVEVFFLDRSRVRRVEGREVIMVRGKPLPLVFLHRHLLRGVSEPEGVGYVVVLQIGNEKMGFVTDDVLGQEEVVIKPLGALLHGIRGFAGATITGDGKIALIIDVNGLLRSVGG
ncbi:chemotaxis protein CheA [Wenzhouxiangella limi]|uniref:Chemotaxis protein CheA n=1 Tax=Wenzhouxiangella limi TaxID=2707351 RepID=A0A845UXB4_9GAMM|nr:chemotaxis protein CheA [Wenzhouxiangella limi]NDY95328.1 chemotaxis protein CheA [Wenzhouxiangella limi]